jgi:hypothetical protein
MQCQPYRQFAHVCENSTDCMPNQNMICQSYQDVCHCPQSQSNELCLCPPPRNEIVTYCDCSTDTRYIVGKGCSKGFIFFSKITNACLKLIILILVEAYEFDFGHLCEFDYECRSDYDLVCYEGKCT